MALHAAQRWHVLATFEPGHGALRGAHALRDLDLREPRAGTRRDQFAGDLKLGGLGLVFGAGVRPGQHLGFQSFERFDRCASNRFSAVSMALRGVACVFFTKTRSTSRRRPWTAAYTARAIPSRPCMRISHSLLSNG